MNQPSGFLTSATVDQLMEILSPIGTSAAVFEREDNAFRTLAANLKFLEMIGNETFKEEMFPCSLAYLFPRYAQRQFTECLVKIHSDPRAIDAEFPFDRSGETHWWRCSFAPIFDPAGSIDRVFCTGIDITEKHRLRLALDTSRSMLQAVVENAYDGILVCNRQGMIKSANEAALGIFGYEQDELVEQPLNILLPEEIREKHNAFLESFAASPIQARIMQERAQVHGMRKDGSIFPAEVSISKTQASTGLEFTAIIRDETEKLDLIDQLRVEATTDYLTGLHNRRSFIKRLEEEISRSNRYDRPLSVAVIDVDDFKMINDTRGHEVGDKVLVALGDLFQDKCRDHDICGRIGGEEFCVLMPETTLEKASESAERLRKSVEECMTVDELRFTASFGVATFQNTEVSTQILSRADEKLYEAKAQGKNRVVA